MLSINEYLSQDERKFPRLLLQWVVLIGFIILFLLGMNHCIKFKHYYKCQGIAEDGYISTYIPINDIDKIINNDKVYIDMDEYSYKIKEVKEEIYNNNLFYYQRLLIDVDFNDKSLIDNRVIEVKFILSEETVLEYLFNFIRR